MKNIFQSTLGRGAMLSAFLVGALTVSANEGTQGAVSGETQSLTGAHRVDPNTGVATLYAVVSLVAQAEEDGEDLQEIKNFLQATQGPIQSALVSKVEAVEDAVKFKAVVDGEEIVLDGHPGEKKFINEYHIARQSVDGEDTHVLVITEVMEWVEREVSPGNVDKKYVTSFDPVRSRTENNSNYSLTALDATEGADVSHNSKVANDFLEALAKKAKDVRRILAGKNLDNHGVIRGNIVYNQDGTPQRYLLNGLANLAKGNAQENLETLEDVYDSARSGSIQITRSVGNEGTSKEEVNFSVSIQSGAFDRVE